MSETLTGTTTEEMLFRSVHDVTCTSMVRYPAGTTVYVTERRDGAYVARIPGTLLERVIHLLDVEPS